MPAELQRRPSARQFKRESVIRDSARNRDVGELCSSLSGKCVKGPRAEAQRVLVGLAYGNACFCEGVQADPSCLSCQDVPSREPEHVDSPPTAVVIACADCELPPEVAFRQCQGELVVVRVPANVLDCASMSTVQDAVQTVGVRLVIVLGHTHCDAVEDSVQQWMALDGASLSCKQYPLPLPEPGSPQSDDYSGSPGSSPKMPPTPAKRGFLGRLFVCARPPTADMDGEAGSDSPRLASPAPVSPVSPIDEDPIPDTVMCSTALAAAIDDVAESRSKAEMAEQAKQAHHCHLQGPYSSPALAQKYMESPRAHRLDGLDGVEWLHTLNHALVAADAKRRAISHDEETVRAVSAANAKLSAQAVLKSLVKCVSQRVMREVQVVAAQLDHCDGKVEVLKTCWYGHGTYYYE